METVTLYTRQHEHSLHELETTGRMTNKRLYVELHMRDIAPFFLEKYDHFVALAERIIPRPADSPYPIWASISKQNCLKPIDKEIVYCLEVPVDRIIYFDGGKWDYVLNDLYIPADDTDARRYARELKMLHVDNQFEFLHGKYKGYFPEIEKRIVDSWERIFTIDRWDHFVVQANLWEIRREWIRHIVRPGEDFFKITVDMEDSDHEAVYRRLIDTKKRRNHPPRYCRDAKPAPRDFP